MRVGERIVVERAYSAADVAAFAEVTGDKGPWHMVPDATGRLVVHGLATVALTTRVGGAMGFMARRFEIDFLRPVYSGETLRCELTLTELAEAQSGALGRERAAATRVAAEAVITNPKGEAVARVRTAGVIPRPFSEVQLDDPRARL